MIVKVSADVSAAFFLSLYRLSIVAIVELYYLKYDKNSFVMYNTVNF